MNAHELKRLFPNASASTQARNNTYHQPSGAEPEPAVCNGPLAEGQGEKRNTGKITVRITSFRTRLLDPDNLCPKYFIDGLRYAGLIPDDRPQDINLEVAQEKVGARTEEKTVITIELV